MKRAVRAAIAYFASIFSLGFVLGTIRTLWLAPMLGEVLAVAAELPVMVTASWFAAHWLVARFAVPAGTPRILMGTLAFALLMAAEAALGVLAFGVSLQQWAASLFAIPGILGLAGQLAFAVIPMAVDRREKE